MTFASRQNYVGLTIRLQLSRALCNIVASWYRNREWAMRIDGQFTPHNPVEVPSKKQIPFDFQMRSIHFVRYITIHSLVQGTYSHYRVDARTQLDKHTGKPCWTQNIFCSLIMDLLIIYGSLHRPIATTHTSVFLLWQIKALWLISNNSWASAVPENTLCFWI